MQKKFIAILLVFVSMSSPSLAQHAEHSVQTAECPSNFYYFAEPNDVSNNMHLHLQPWTDTEKLRITKSLNFAFKQAPGLILRCSQDKPVALFRTNTFLKKDGTVDTSIAYATGQSIAFADTFFAKRVLDHDLLHELVHMADYSRRTCYGKKWVEFAGPIISQVKKLRMAGNKSLDKIEIELRQSGTCPSLNGAKDLVEAFAEYLAEFIEGTSFPVSEKFKQTIAMPFLTPTIEDLNYEKKYRMVETCKQSHEYQTAVSLLSDLLRTAPENPFPYVDLCECLINSKQYKLARLIAERGSAEFKNNTVSLNEKPRYDLLLYLGSLDLHLGYYPSGISVLNQLIEQNLLDERPFRYRGQIYEKQHHLALAAKDYWSASYDHGCNIHRVYLQQVDKPRYLKALPNYQKHLNKFSHLNSQRSPLLVKAELLLHLAKFAKAKILIDRALATYPDAIYPNIMLVEIYEKSGRTSLAAHQFLKAKQLIARYQEAFSSLSWAL